MKEEKIIINKELNILEALIPLLVVIVLLSLNILYADEVLFAEIFRKLSNSETLINLGNGYSNQLILLTGGFIALIMGFLNKVSFKAMLLEIWDNFKKTSGAILILVLVGALSGTWLISGIIPTMVYYGIQILSPSIFLPATILITIIISLATGSSWTTTATVGIALISVGATLGFNPGMVAGAVISGAYFGDKMSPLSDTTNLAPAMAGAELMTHIKYMMYTTIPSIVITFIVFGILSFTTETNGSTEVSEIINTLESYFIIDPWLFLVPLSVVVLIILKAKPFIAILIGVLMAAIFAVIFQPEVVKNITNASELNFKSIFDGLSKVIFFEYALDVENEKFLRLFSSKGMEGMLYTVYLIISALIFGGIMEAIGALSRLSSALLSLANNVFGLFTSTVASCLIINITASDQYLAIVVPGKMFEKAYKEKGLAPENLSRTLEDTGTVTSALIPWNTCGAYQAKTLGVDVGDYFFYAIFNYVSPIMTLIFAYFQIRIKMLKNK